MYLLGARYYQLTGKIREWLGIKRNDVTSIAMGRWYQLVGSIAEEYNLSIAEAKAIAESTSSLLYSASVR